MWARTLCPLLSSTRNIAFGRASTTVPSISITPSFFGMSSAICCWLVYRWCTALAGRVQVAREPPRLGRVDLAEPARAPLPGHDEGLDLESFTVCRAAAGHHETGPRWADI